MDRIKIIGGRSLNGIIKISGSKNASLPILAATLLTENKFKISNIPRLSDVFSMIELLKSLNVKISFDSNMIVTRSFPPKSLKAPYEHVRKMRASFLILGPLLAKYGYAEVSLPGGCAIGERPINFHIEGFKQMGAEFIIKEGYIRAKVKGRLKGAKIKLSQKSVGATENLMIAASLANGKTIIENAAREPEIEDLANFLNKMGADIKGHGTDKIQILGKKNLSGCIYSVMPDRIEIGTYVLCILGCKGKILFDNLTVSVIENTKKTFSFIKELKFEKKNNNQLQVSRESILLSSLDVETQPYPGFPTDLQAQLIASVLKSDGRSSVKENIFENRFMHVSELKRMGADLELSKSKVNIVGKKKIYGAEVMATDLRASSSLVIAGLMAEGETIINRIYHLDRGYENLEKKLQQCGAQIQRIKT